MSVRVNLLPEATRARGRASQQRSWLVLAAVVFLLILGGVYWWAAREVGAAEDELVAAQARTAQLQSEQNELLAFSELADRRDAATETLQTAMAPEVSLAGVLQDLAAVVPSDTQLENLAIDITGPVEETPGVGTFNLTGRTLTSHAPGVERVLIQLDKVASFRGLYLNSSTLDDPEERIATFSLDGQIGPEAATGRYDEGLPEELR